MIDFSQFEVLGDIKNADDLKRWLQEYRYMVRDIDNQLERLEFIESKLTSIGSPSLTGVSNGGGPRNDRIADLLSKKLELEEKIGDRITVQKEMRCCIETIVQTLKNPDERVVIQARYIDLMSWSDIEYLLFGGKQDYIDKEDGYLRRTFKIHCSALNNITEKITAETSSK